MNNEICRRMVISEALDHEAHSIDSRDQHGSPWFSEDHWEDQAHILETRMEGSRATLPNNYCPGSPDRASVASARSWLEAQRHLQRELIFFTFVWLLLHAFVNALPNGIHNWYMQARATAQNQNWAGALPPHPLKICKTPSHGQHSLTENPSHSTNSTEAECLPYTMWLFYLALDKL
jgi:hypothetical protein